MALGYYFSEFGGEWNGCAFGGLDELAIFYFYNGATVGDFDVVANVSCLGSDVMVAATSASG